MSLSSSNSPQESNKHSSQNVTVFHLQSIVLTFFSSHYTVPHASPFSSCMFFLKIGWKLKSNLPGFLCCVFHLLFVYALVFPQNVKVYKNIVKFSVIQWIMDYRQDTVPYLQLSVPSLMRDHHGSIVVAPYSPEPLDCQSDLETKCHCLTEGSHCRH